ncbi:MAG: SLC13 family permease, partial [Desulfofustis sp.]|nr:SLC13 family permease [Desulfofustis sp.]
MGISQWVVLAIFLSTIAALIFTEKRPSHVFAGTMVALVFTGELAFEQVLLNITNQGLVTLVLLLLVSAAVEKTSLIKRLARVLVTGNFRGSFVRIFTLAFFSSAILNNTAVVANLIGPIKQNQYHPASKLLIPLSYAAILGGTVTLIGTSTNLIVNSFLIEHGHPGFSFWDFTVYGLIAGIVCGILMYFLHPLLPNLETKKANYQEYLIEAEVEPDSELVGNSVEDNHLRNLPELFLVEVIRRNRLISPVDPDLVIEVHDKLIFSGNISKVDSLSHIKGLTLFAENSGLLKKNLIEVIVSHRAQIIGQTLKAVGFRALFDAAVVAIRRDGEQLSGKLGEIRLQAGDYLLLATGPDFFSRASQSRNFLILSEQSIATKLPKSQELLILGGFLIVVLLAAMSLMSLPTGLFYLLAVLIGLG